MYIFLHLPPWKHHKIQHTLIRIATIVASPFLGYAKVYMWSKEILVLIFLLIKLITNEIEKINVVELNILFLKDIYKNIYKNFLLNYIIFCIS
jgi:hypothetical protein